MIQHELEARNQQVTLIDITSNPSLFQSEEKTREYLSEIVPPHDVLLIGSPVYAHHLQYHVIDLIKALPKPGGNWGKYAIPYVTYGGISSGIALKEAGELLYQSGRIVHAGLKVSASHKMTRAFMPEEFNREKLSEETIPQVAELVNRIMQLEGNPDVRSNHRSLHYNGLSTLIKASFIFKERVWHEKRYPKISVNADACTLCGRCIAQCPVNHLVKGANHLVENDENPCIHCMNCVVNCSKHAIALTGEMEKGKAFMKHMIEEHGNREKPETSVYPTFENKILSGKNGFGDKVYMGMFRGLESKTRYTKNNPVDVLEISGIRDAKKVLEVGCGSGYFTLPAAKMISANCEYWAIDIHPYAVQETLKKLQNEGVKGIKVEQLNALNTLLPDKSFDQVLLYGVIPSPFLPIDKLMTEMARIMKPGSKLSIWTINTLGIRKEIIGSKLFRYSWKKGNVILFEKI